MSIKTIKKLIPLMLIMLMSITAEAMTVNVVYDLKTRTVTLSGTTEAESVVSMLIYDDEDGTAEVTPENVQDDVFGGFQMKSGIDGTFEKKFAFDLKPGSGWYTALVYSVAEGAHEKVRFYMPDDEASKEMFRQFNEAGADAFYDLVLNYAVNMTVIDVDMADYDAYKDEISALAIEKRAQISGGFASNTDIETAVNSAIAAVNFKYCGEDKISYFAEKYDAFLGIELDEKYGDIKDAVSELFVQMRTDKPEGDTVGMFMEAMALTVLNNSEKTEIEAVLRRYSEVFDMDFDGYEKYDPVEISKALYGKNYTNPDDVKDDYAARITELSNALKGSGISGGGGSGGSRGGSSVKGVTSTIVVDTPAYVEAAEEKALPFEDMDNYEWAKEYVKPLYAMGIISGVTKNEFAPGNHVKRSEISKMICNALETEVIIGENPFTDVDSGAWYAEFVINAYENGLVTGFDGKFNPENNILRRDLAVIVMRALENNGFEKMEGTAFADITENDGYAKEAISSLSAYGIISGKGDGRFAPAEYVTRAEAAKIIYNMMKVVQHE